MHPREALGWNLRTHVIAGEVRRGERMLLSTPLPHSAVPFAGASGAGRGRSITLLPRFDAEVVLDTVAREGISWTFVVPTMLSRLLDVTSIEEAETASLRTIVYDAAPSGYELRRALQHFLDLSAALRPSAAQPCHAARHEAPPCAPVTPAQCKT